MTKHERTSDLMEKRIGLLDAMKTAHTSDDAEKFKALETELRSLDGKIARQKMLDDADRAEPGTPIHGDAKLSTEIRSKFSLVRALASASGIAVDAGFEKEIQSEFAKRVGKPAQGFFVPTEIFEKRVLTTSGGSELVGTDHRPDLYINALSATTIIRSLGCRVLDGLSANLSIPRETGSPSVAWVAENSAITPSDPSFDAVTLSPHHCGTISEYSRNMLQQGSPAVEQLLRDMMSRNIAQAIDRVAIRGGGSNEPTGILANNDIQTVDGSSLDIFTAVANSIALADIANVDASRAVLTNNTVKKIASLARDGQGRPFGIPTVFSNERVAFSNLAATDGNSPAHHPIIFGDFGSLMLGVWSSIDVISNPYLDGAYQKGNVSVRAMATIDIALQHPEAFVSITGVTAASAAMPALS